MKITKKIRNVFKKALSKKEKKTAKYVGSPPPPSQVSEELSDYVSEEALDKISSNSIYLYQCEMPIEMLAKIQAMRAPVCRVRGCFLTYLKNHSSSEALGSFRDPRCIHDANSNEVVGNITPSKILCVGAKKSVSDVAREKVLASHEDYMDMDEEEPNYDDFMYLSDSSLPSRLQGASRSGIIRPRRLSYSCKDPILDLLPEYSRLKMTHWCKSSSY